MEKILSVCIPSYNMEKFIKRNLDSFVASGCLDELELIVVNDGSKDKTLEIANSYKEQFPNTIVVVNKPNGHYGSCVNAALKIATGKYFRLVDADDWVDSDVLKKVIKCMKIVSVDCFFTRYTKVYEDTGEKVLEDVTNMNYNKVLDLSSFVIPERCLAMHSISFCRELLVQMGYIQTEGICYTDTEFVYFPMSKSRTLYALNDSLYQYLIGRDGQTMDQKSLKRNVSHFLKIFDRIQFSWENEIQYKDAYNLRLYDIYANRLLTSIATSALLFNSDKALEKAFYERFCKVEQRLQKVILKCKIRGVPFIKCWIRNSIVDRIVIRIIRTYYSLKVQ